MIAIAVETSSFDKMHILTLRLKQKPNMAELERLKQHCTDGKTLDVTIKKYRKKRSIDANAYLWQLLAKMAEVLETDKWFVYLKMLKIYGKFTHIVVKPTVVDAMKLQWREIEVVGEIEVNGQVGVQLLCYFGSSSYDTKEMSVLINGVVSEAKELGIETLPPKELESMIYAYTKND